MRPLLGPGLVIHLSVEVRSRLGNSAWIESKANAFTVHVGSSLLSPAPASGVFPSSNPANSPLISIVEFDGSGGLGVNNVRLQIGGGDYDGEIAEIIFFSDDPTTLANGKIHEHLKAKYNVDFAGP